MPEYTVDVWGTGPTPENYQHIKAESPEEAEQKARDLSSELMITNVEATEVASY